MLKPNNTADAISCPADLRGWRVTVWGLDDPVGYRVLGGPSGITILCPPSGLWRDPGRCAEKLCLDKEVHLSCSSFTPSKEKRLITKTDFHSFREFKTSVIRQGFSSVQTWKWRLLRMHILPHVFAPTSFRFQT